MKLNYKKALEGWQEPPKKEESEKQFLEYISSLIKANNKKNRMLDSILAAIIEGEKGEETDKVISQYIAKSEELFLNEKLLINYLEHKSLELNAEEKIEILGKWKNHPEYSLEKKEGEYIFILPPMISQYKNERRANEGLAIYRTVLFLIDDFAKRNPEGMEQFDNASITFYHFVDKKLPESCVPDPDNIDIKKTIDAMQGSIIISDNLLHLDLSHITEIAEKSYTKIVLKPKKTGTKI